MDFARLMKRPGLSLRPIQAATLEAVAAHRGVVCGARVGAGKTLLSGLIPVVLGAQRPLIVVSGKGDIPEKTREAFRQYRKDWNIADVYKLITYEALSRKDGEQQLLDWQPDLIVADECQNWRRVTENKGARKVARYMAAHPGTAYAALSGSLFKFGLSDYAHHFAWAFGQYSPLPTNREDIDRLSRQLMEEPWRMDEMAARIRAHTGVIISDDVFDGVGLSIEPLFMESGLDDEMEHVRTHLVKPDGSPLILGDDEDDTPGATSVASVVRQLALGFFYVPKPRPPASYVAARKSWFGAVNGLIADGLFDQPSQVKDHAKRVGGSLLKKLEKWEAARNEFKFESEPVWLKDLVLEGLTDWGQEGGIIWTKHTAVGQRLELVSGFPYYGAGGKHKKRGSILRAKAPTIIASANALSVGHNLQAWHRGCITNCPSNSADMEQTVGRQFRDGQMNDVDFRILVSCEEHLNALEKAEKLAIIEERQLRKRTILGSIAK